MNHSVEAEDQTECTHLTPVVKDYLVANDLPGCMLRRRCVTLCESCEVVKKLWQQSEYPGINGEMGSSSGQASEHSCQSKHRMAAATSEKPRWLHHLPVHVFREGVSNTAAIVTLYYLRDRSNLAVGGSHPSSVAGHGEVWWTVWRRKQQVNHICGDGPKQNIDHADHFRPTSCPQNTERNQVPKQVPWMDTRGEWFPVKKDVSTSKPQTWPGTPSWMMHQSWPSRNSEILRSYNKAAESTGGELKSAQLTGNENQPDANSWFSCCRAQCVGGWVATPSFTEEPSEDQTQAGLWDVFFFQENEETNAETLLIYTSNDNSAPVWTSLLKMKCFMLFNM